MDELKRKLIANLQNYLRERMDFIASLPTMDPTWSAPFNIIDNIFRPILDNLGGKCPNLFLLFDNIAKSEGIRAGAISFEIKIITNTNTYTSNACFSVIGSEISYNFESKGEDSPVAIYLGTSGCQAFYSIIENIIRNTTRHSKREKIEEVKSESEKIIKKQPFDPNKILKITIEFHYDDKENKYQDDYISVRIYDNMGGWEKESDNIWVFKEKRDGKEELKLAVLVDEKKENEAKEKLKKYIDKKDEGEIEKELNDKIFNRKFNPNYPEGRIIDETGKVIEGNWGLKEMRICASFLRGLKISDYEQVPKDAPPVIIPFIQPSDDKNGSLGFEFCIPKVKFLLVVSNDEKIQELNKEEYKNNGIYLVNSIDKVKQLIDKGTLTHEFILVDIDNSQNIEFVKRNILKLPYKLFYLISDKGNLNKTGIVEVDKFADKRVIEKKEIKEWVSNNSFEFESQVINLNSSQKILLEIYRKWYFYLKVDETILKIGLQPSEDLNGRWEYGNLFGFNPDKIQDFKSSIKDNILFDHRFDVYKSLKDKNEIPICTFPFTRRRSDKIVKTWRTLVKSRNFDFNNLLAIFETLECASANILVIDERVYDAFSDERNIAENNVFLAYYWFLQNVTSLNLLGIEKDKFTFEGYRIKHPINLGEKLNKNKDEIKKFLPEHFKNKLHFLIIHRSIIHSSKMGGLSGFEKFIQQLPEEFKPWYIIITSGIGHPHQSEMPSGSKFVHISELIRVFTKDLDKFKLLKIITSLKEKE